jgi:hypothetical protein
VRCAIRWVFIEIWDPIGVMTDPDWPRDNYDGYIGRIVELQCRVASDEEIVDYLSRATNEHIGLSARCEQLTPVVKALRQIPIPDVK